MFCNNNFYSLRASDRFIQPIFLRIFRSIGPFIRDNGCNICWSAVNCMGNSLQRPLVMFSPNLTIVYHVPYIAKFCVEESSNQKDSKISGTHQKSNTKIGIRSVYLSSILHWFYPKRYMISFWYGNTLLKGNFKNTKLIKICGGNRWSDRSFFT